MSLSSVKGLFNAFSCCARKPNVTSPMSRDELLRLREQSSAAAALEQSQVHVIGLRERNGTYTSAQADLARFDVRHSQDEFVVSPRRLNSAELALQQSEVRNLAQRIQNGRLTEQAAEQQFPTTYRALLVRRADAAWLNQE